jgi:hypothetical protein
LDDVTQWIGTDPLGPTELRGHVVLFDFCTFTCINWLRQLPYVRAWSRAYRADGLVVIGVHTPEFSFEHDVDRVRRALTALAIDYPVAIDNDYAIWSAFANHYWPALYFVDTEGVIRDFHYGEGRYEQSERVIQKLLGIERDLGPIRATGIETQPAWHSLRSTETYLGFDRGERFASPGGRAFQERRTYRAPDRLRSDHWALAGDWTIERERAVLDAAGGSIHYRFHARDAHLVLSVRGSEPVPFRVLLDGEIPGASHGLDVDEQGNGILDEARLYQLVRQHGTIHKRELEVTFLASGVEAYSFSFG